MMLFAGRRGDAHARRHRLRAGVAEASVQAECESQPAGEGRERGARPNGREGEGDMRRAVIGVIAVMSLALVSGTVFAKDKRDGRITLTTDSVGVIVGYSWGKGVLTYKGKQYPFTIDGVSVGSLGAAKASASGNVYHLSKLEDFSGTYTATSPGATVGGGGSATIMKNQQGVVINMVATSQGLKLKLAVDGIKIALKQ